MTAWQDRTGNALAGIVARRQFQFDIDDFMVCCLSLFVIIGAISIEGTVAKYVFYILPVVGCLASVLVRRQMFREGSQRELLIGGAIVFYGLWVTVLSKAYNFYSIREMGLISLPFFTAAYIRNITARHLKIIGLAFSVAIAIYALLGHARSGAFSWASSSSWIETPFIFPIMLIFLTFFITGTNRWYQALFVVLAVVSLKRIAVVGVVLALGFYLFDRILTAMFGRLGSRIAYLSALIALIGMIAVGVYMPQFIMELNRHIRIFNLSPEEVMQGRYAFQTFTQNYMDLHRSALHQLFGFGYGQSARVIIIGGFDPAELIHDDFMKMYFEGGIFLLAGLCTTLLCAYGRTNRQMVLIIYQFSLFMTDNTLIYAFHMTVFLLCARYLETLQSGARASRKFGLSTRPPNPFNRLRTSPYPGSNVE